MTQATPTSTPLLHGRYRIEEQIGTGRLAVVYRAYDERLMRPVLVHMLRKELMSQEALLQRFVQEAHHSARRSHQSLLEIYDSGEIAGRPYMITEYVTGRTLRELGALSLEESLLYFRQIVGAVAASQAAGVPHPPISSSNIILVEDGHVELIESWRTPPGEMALDLACYRPPERTAGGPVTAASVVYSLGLLLIEMLTGRRVISGDDARAIAQAHLTARIPPLSAIRPLLYLPSLERLLQSATARRPEDRPPDAAALGQALDDLRRDITGDTRRLALPPVQAPGLRERIRRTTGALAAPVAAPMRRAHASPGVPLPVQAEVGRRRSMRGMVIMLALFVVVACVGYYSATLIAKRVSNVELPTLTFSLPQLPELGINLNLPTPPDWLTGVVSGGGQVWIVNSPNGLNLRKTPGLQTEVVTLLPNTALVRQIGEPRTVDGVKWLPVRAKVDGAIVEGWVSSSYVKPE